MLPAGYVRACEDAVTARRPFPPPAPRDISAGHEFEFDKVFQGADAHTHLFHGTSVLLLSALRPCFISGECVAELLPLLDGVLTGKNGCVFAVRNNAGKAVSTCQHSFLSIS